MLPTPSTESNETPQTNDRYGLNLGQALGITPLIGGPPHLVDNVGYHHYTPAITRWETVLNRPAPATTQPTGRDGTPRLSPLFVEWMMGLPPGHVTNTPDLTRNAQLKALGNGVVPQQAAAAITHLLGVKDTTTPHIVE